MATRTTTQATPSTEPVTSKSNLLRNTLRANAIFCAVSGLLFIFAGNGIAEFMGITETSILGLFNGDGFITFIGFGLLPYAALLTSIFTKPVISRGWAWFAIEADLAWVVASWIILLTNALNMNSAGNWATLIVADVVTAFAILQYVGLRRMTRS